MTKRIFFPIAEVHSVPDPRISYVEKTQTQMHGKVLDIIIRICRILSMIIFYDEPTSNIR